jgi:hypothetical protein
MAEEKVAAFKPGDRVVRIEEREHVAATVVGVDKMVGPEEYFSYLITYDEGGEGWWPEDSLKPEA